MTLQIARHHLPSGHYGLIPVGLHSHLGPYTHLSQHCLIVAWRADKLAARLNRGDGGGDCGGDGNSFGQWRIGFLDGY
jgi:hypothetical protein